MRKLGIALALVVAAALVTSTPAMAQAAKKKQRQRISPHETITAKIDGDEMKLVYGRPYTKKPGTTEARKIWGGLVPYGKVWRTGADEATLLTTAQPIELGGYSLAPGTYSLFTVPYEDGTAKLVINKKTGQWGIPYNEDSEKANELARVDLKKSTLDKTVDQFTMAIEPEAGGGAAQDDVGEHPVLDPVHREEVRPNGRTLPLTSIAALLFGRDGLPNSEAWPCPHHDAPAGRIGPPLGSSHSSWRGPC